MANDSTNAGQVSSEQDTTPIHDSYFSDMQGEDAFFGPEQLAQANTGTQVVVPQDQNVIRVQVSPGEIIELSSPFDPGAVLLAREADGNLAIRVGDITVILVGYVAANDAAPVVIETSDGQPIDIATLLASTDPNIDIQTAAGPGEAGQGGQGADNTGALLTQLQGGEGLGGLNAVGAQDGTSLNYRSIDNSGILRDFDETTLSPLDTSFKGLSEPFLRDPFSNDPFSTFGEFLSAYETYVGTTNPGGGWADFEGTSATGTDFESYLAQTSFTNLVSHSSTAPETMHINFPALTALLGSMTSNGNDLYIDGNSTTDTVFVRREGDDALVLVIHAHAPGDLDDTTPPNGTGGYQIDTFLINRLDHPDEGKDLIDFEVPYFIPQPVDGEELPQEQLQLQEYCEYDPKEGPQEGDLLGSVHVDIQDDIPIAGETVYLNFLHATSYDNAFACLTAFAKGKITDYEITTGAGHADEDYIFGGNHDKDNKNGPDSDPARGDDIGDKFVVGALVFEWGADGPSGMIPPGGKPSKGDLFPCVPALQITGLCEGEIFPGVTSGDHTLTVLKHETFLGLEILQVGYSKCEDGASQPSGLNGFGGWNDEVVVFTLVLQANPNAPLFGAFAFELCEPLDHVPGSTPESNLALVIPITATDDDGDHPLDDINITIQVNDDAPVIKDVDYISWKGGIPDLEPTAALSGGGHNDTIKSDDYGQVDEDWLKGGATNDVLTVDLGGTGGNQDKDGTGDNNAGQDGDEFGKTRVKGEIDVKFGGDGPAEDNPFALKTFDTGNPDSLPVFKDADGNSFKSGGHQLVVLQSDEGFIQVGYIPESENGSDFAPKPVVIFTMEIDDDGEFEFDLCGPIDHTGQNEQTLPIKFDVTVSDNDGDTAEVTLEIKVNDDKPEIGICYFNNLEADVKRETVDAGLAMLSGGGANDVFKTEDFGHVDEDWLHGGGYNDYLGNQDKDGAGNSNAGDDGDDSGKTRVCGQVTVKYGGDGPSGDDAPLAIHQYTQGAVFKDGDGTGNSFKSGGQDLVVLHSEAGLLVVGIQGVLLPGAATSSESYDQTIFTLTLNSSGQFEFDLYGPIDHDPQAGEDGSETNALISFNVGSATDNDGDKADAVIKIQVNDDTPELGITYYNEIPGEGGSDGLSVQSSSVGRVDEDWLSNDLDAAINAGPQSMEAGNGNQDKDGLGNGNANLNGDADGGTTVTGNVSLNYGGDGPGDPLTTISLATLAVGSDFLDGEGNPVTSQGNSLKVLESDGEHLVVGYGDAENPTVVFTLDLDPANMSFAFELRDALDQSYGDQTEASLNLAFVVNSDATDGDEDPATGVIKIEVNDDVPHAVNEEEHDFDAPGDISANVLTNDKGGADGIKVTQISGYSGSFEVADNGLQMAGAHGAFFIMQDGSYTYTPNPEDLGSDTFTYTVTDGDGDTSTATVTFNYTGEVERVAFTPSGPTHTVADNYDLTLNVTKDTDATKNKAYHDGDSVEINDTDTGLFGTGLFAGHTLKGGSGDDHLVGNAGGDNLQGRDGNDILEGGDGGDQLHGGNGDDTLYGGNNDDDLYGDAGHDAMSGGDGSDTFHDVDADDLDGTNTLDGFHTIDGGDGYDKVDISGLKSFDTSQAMRLENVEHLALDGKADGGGQTSVTLNYDAAYGITQVGGLHVLAITGDKGDAVSLVGSGGKAWVSDGDLFGTQFFHAGSGADKVTVTVEQGVTVALS